MNPVIGLSVGRIAVGTVALAQPALGARLLGLDAEGNPQLGYMGRLFGSREIALGLLTLLARGSSRRNLVLAGIAIDVADAATAALGARDKAVPVRTAATLFGPAVGAVGAGIAGLRVRKRLEA